MRILFVNERASAQGGVESNVIDSARGLVARGHVVALAHEDRAPDETFRDVFATLFPLAPHLMVPHLGRPHLASHIRKHLSHDDLAPRLLAACDAFEADVVYLHKTENASVLATERLHTPTVRMVHDHDLTCQRRHRYLPITHTLCTRPAHPIGCLRCGGLFERRRGAPFGLGWRPLSARFADLAATRRMARTLVASHAMAEELVANGIPRTHIRIVPLGVPDTPTDARPEPDQREAEQRDPQAPPRILFLGQILRTKGIDLLLEALHRCRAPWQLHIVGTGPQERELRALTRHLGLSHAVSWHGRLTPAEVAATTSAMDLVAVPSRWAEPFGRGGLEAMRAGLPVVGFDVGGIPDWLDDGRTGLLAPAGDIDALSRALDALLGDAELRQQLGRAGRRSFLAQFTMDAYLDRLETTLLDVVEEN